jgi:hypothetical protein
MGRMVRSFRDFRSDVTRHMMTHSHPYAIHEKALNAERNHGPHYWQVNEGGKWRDEVVEIAETGSKPVVEVCATKCRLHCFQKENTIHYRMYVREKHV